MKETTEITDKADVAVDSVSSENAALKSIIQAQPSLRDQDKSRVDVLVGVGGIDVALQELLTTRLAPPMGDRDDLLSEGELLGTFMLRAKLAMRLGLISPELYAVMKHLSKIRNLSAHSEQRVDVFALNEVKSRINGIWSRIDDSFKTNENTPESKFNSICGLVRAIIIFITQNQQPIMTLRTEVLFKGSF